MYHSVESTVDLRNAVKQFQIIIYFDAVTQIHVDAALTTSTYETKHFLNECVLVGVCAILVSTMNVVVDDLINAEVELQLF